MNKGTKKIINEIEPLHREIYKLNSNSIRANIQGGLYEDIPEKSIVPFSGYCFELLAQSIFGNSHHNGGLFELEKEGPIFQPDLFNKTGDLVETKSCYEKTQLKLKRSQMAGYANYMLKNPDKKIDFTFFSHAIDGMVRRELSRNQYLEEFPDKINFLIKAPSVVPLQFYMPGECAFRGVEYERTNKTNRGYNSSSVLSISSTFLRELLKNPKDILDSINLDPDNFNFKRYAVEGINVNKKEIQKFPLLEIGIKNRDKYIKTRKESLEDLIMSSRDTKVEIPTNPVSKKPEEKDPWDNEYNEPVEEDEPLF